MGKPTFDSRNSKCIVMQMMVFLDFRLSVEGMELLNT
jgi:hypothetical protein